MHVHCMRHSWDVLLQCSAPYTVINTHLDWTSSKCHCAAHPAHALLNASRRCLFLSAVVNVLAGSAVHPQLWMPWGLKLSSDFCFQHCRTKIHSTRLSCIQSISGYVEHGKCLISVIARPSSSTEMDQCSSNTKRSIYASTTLPTEKISISKLLVLHVNKWHHGRSLVNW